MNQEQNNLKSNNFNTQDNNGIPNNQPLQNNQNLNNISVEYQQQNINSDISQQSFNHINEESKINSGINQQIINNQSQIVQNHQQPINQITPQSNTVQSTNSFENLNTTTQNVSSKQSKKNLILIFGLVGIFVIALIILFVILLNNGSSKTESNNNNTLNEQSFVDKNRLTQKEYSIENVGENFSINVTTFITNEDGIEEEIKKIFSFKESDNIQFSNYNIVGDFSLDVVNKNKRKLFSIEVDLENNATLDYYKQYYTTDSEYINTIVETTEDTLSYYYINPSNYKYYYFMRDIDGKVFSFEYTDFGNGIQLTQEQIYDYLEQASDCIIPDDNSPFIEDKVMLIPLVLDKKIISNEHFYSISKETIELKKNIGDLWEKEESYSLEINFKQEDSIKEKVSNSPNISRYEKYPEIYSYEITENNIINTFTPTHFLIDKEYGVDTVEGMYEIINMFLINKEV